MIKHAPKILASEEIATTTKKDNGDCVFFYVIKVSSSRLSIFISSITCTFIAVFSGLVPFSQLQKHPKGDGWGRGVHAFFSI